MNSSTSQELPQFYELLNLEDKKQYNYMKSTLSSSVCKNRRNQSTKTFDQILKMIKGFSIRNNSDDWKRCIVCGLFWLQDNEIAVNSKQLCLLLSKCKSSINGSLQALHYFKVPNNLDHVKKFIKTIPLMQINPDMIELRQWTIRKLDPDGKPVFQEEIKHHKTPFMPQPKAAHNQSTEIPQQFDDVIESSPKIIPVVDEDFILSDTPFSVNDFREFSIHPIFSLHDDLNNGLNDDHKPFYMSDFY